MDLMPKEYKNPGVFGVPAGGGSLRTIRNWADLKLYFQSHKTPFIKFTTMTVLGLLILAVLSWAGLMIFQKSLLDGSVKTQAQYVNVFTPEDKDLANRILALQKRTVALQAILKSHVYTSQLLEILSKITLPQVQWKSYDLNVQNRQIYLKGRAANYLVLAKQVLALEQGGFLNVSVSGISLDESGAATFSVEFEFDPKNIQKIPNP